MAGSEYVMVNIDGSSVVLFAEEPPDEDTSDEEPPVKVPSAEEPPAEVPSDEEPPIGKESSDYDIPQSEALKFFATLVKEMLGECIDINSLSTDELKNKYQSKVIERLRPDGNYTRLMWMFGPNIFAEESVIRMLPRPSKLDGEWLRKYVFSNI